MNVPLVASEYRRLASCVCLELNRVDKLSRPNVNSDDSLSFVAKQFESIPSNKAVRRAFNEPLILDIIEEKL